MIRRPPRSTLLPSTALFRCRINMSHGSHEEHVDTIARARAAASRLKRPLSVLVDLSGPKIRSEEHTSELPSRQYLGCRLLLVKNNTNTPLPYRASTYTVPGI